MIRDRADGPIEDVEFRGAEPERRRRRRCSRRSRAPRAVIVGPSNPVISIGPILALPGMRDALRDCPGPVVAVSPLVGGRSLKGPTEAFLAWAGQPLSSDGIAACYDGLLDGLVADERTDALPTLETDVAMPDADGAPPASPTRRCDFALALGRIASGADAHRRRPARQVVRARQAAPRRGGRAAGRGPSSPPRWSATCSPRSRRVAALDDLVVVTAEPRAAAAARAAGAHVVDDPAEAGQSDAAALGDRRRRRARRASASLLVPGDCPALDPAEVAALLDGVRAAPAS